MDDVFVSESVKTDGSREYESVWFFNPSAAMEAQRFVKDDDFDFAPLKAKVSRWNIEKQNYDFVKATDNSRLTVGGSIHGGLTFLLKASKENCDHLRDIFLKYIMANTQMN